MTDIYLPVNIKVKNPVAFYEALDKFHIIKNYDDFFQLVATEVNDLLHRNLRVRILKNNRYKGIET